MTPWTTSILFSACRSSPFDGGEKAPPLSSNPPPPDSAPAPWQIGFDSRIKEWVLKGYQSKEPPPVCREREAPVLCLTRSAVLQAKENHFEKGVGYCQWIDQPDFRSDCFFQSAEYAISLDPEIFQKAVLLCSAAYPNDSYCLIHSAFTLGSRFVPPADSLLPGAWRQMEQNLKELEKILGGQGFSSPEHFDDLFWATAIDQSIGRSKFLNGALYAHVPTEAHPHVRASLAHYLMANVETRRLRPLSLAEWMERLGKVEGITDPDKGIIKIPTKEEHFREAPRVPPLWESMAPGEERFLRTIYRGYGTSMRGVIPDNKKADGAVSILEAGARLPDEGNRTPLLEEGLTYPDPLVQWTARRLLDKMITHR